MGEWELVLRTYPVHMPDRKDSNKSTVEAQTENPTDKEVNENIVATKEDNVEPQTETNGGIVEDNLEIIKPEDTSSEHNQRRSNNLMEDGTAAKLPQIEDFYEMSDTERHEYISGIEKLFDSEIDVTKKCELIIENIKRLEGKDLNKLYKTLYKKIEFNQKRLLDIINNNNYESIEIKEHTGLYNKNIKL